MIKRNITIRRAQTNDNADIIRLLQQIGALHHKGRSDIFKESYQKYSREEFETILNNKNRPVFVAADDNNNILGYCFCMIHNYAAHPVVNDYSSLYIDDFCVDENCRGLGIGKMIFAAVKKYAEQIKVYNIELNVWEFNESAVKFYEICGFSTQRRRMEIIL